MCWLVEVREHAKLCAIVFFEMAFPLDCKHSGTWSTLCRVAFRTYNREKTLAIWSGWQYLKYLWSYSMEFDFHINGRISGFDQIFVELRSAWTTKNLYWLVEVSGLCKTCCDYLPWMTFPLYLKHTFMLRCDPHGQQGTGTASLSGWASVNYFWSPTMELFFYLLKYFWIWSILKWIFIDMDSRKVMLVRWRW